MERREGRKFLSRTTTRGLRTDLSVSDGDWRSTSRPTNPPTIRRLVQIVYGDTCASGPLGGDAEISSSLVHGDIGAGKKTTSVPLCHVYLGSHFTHLASNHLSISVVFFIDPLTSHPHQADIDSLCRLCLVHDVPIMHNRSSAIPLMLMLKTALETPGMAESVVSFFLRRISSTINLPPATQLTCHANKIPSFFRSLESPAVADYKLQQKKMMSEHMRRRASVCSVGGVQSLSRPTPPARRGGRGLRRDMLGNSMLLSSEEISERHEETNNDNRGNPTSYLPLCDPLGNSMHCTNLLAGLEEVDTNSRRPSVTPSTRSSVASMASVEETIEEDVLSSEEFEGEPERSSSTSLGAPDTSSATVAVEEPGRSPYSRAKRWFRRVSSKARRR